jgi:hypothetical protein
MTDKPFLDEKYEALNRLNRLVELLRSLKGLPDKEQDAVRWFTHGVVDYLSQVAPTQRDVKSLCRVLGLSGYKPGMSAEEKSDGYKIQKYFFYLGCLSSTLSD